MRGDGSNPPHPEELAAARAKASVSKDEAATCFHELAGENRPLDVEQFGMRHRSAIKLVSQQNDLRVLVVSQDGPISAVWWDKQQVFVRRGVSLVNMNIPWA